MKTEPHHIATHIRDSLADATGKTRRMKVRSLLARFGYEKRSDTNTGVITESLSAAGVAINPAIIRLGNEWQLDIDDWIYVTWEDTIVADDPAKPHDGLPPGWNDDGWFDRLVNLKLRSEKEVENKFIIPLLSRLGYSEDDRYDGMSCKASVGSRKTTYTTDFALYNVDDEGLKGQVLLIAEAKKEDKLKRPTELENAFRQAKSYAMWTQCRHLLVTDGRQIVVYEILRAGQSDSSSVFSCERHELKEHFGALYKKISKPEQSRFYRRFLGALEEAK